MQPTHPKRLSAYVVTSPDPERLADFYRARLGIPFEAQSHGPMQHHLEAWLGDTHLAILKGGRRGPSATFQVDDVAAWTERLHAASCPAVRPLIDLGEGKRLAMFVDPDGNPFQLIEIAAGTGATR